MKTSEERRERRERVVMLIDRKERLTEEKWSCLDCERNVGMEECV